MGRGSCSLEVYRFMGEQTGKSTILVQYDSSDDRDPSGFTGRTNISNLFCDYPESFLF